MSSQLRICLVGGIYGKDFAYRLRAQITPETTLEEGLRQRGHLIATRSHYTRIAEEEFDVLHVHHLGMGALRAALRRSATPLVFTLHDPRVMQGGLSPIRNRSLRLVLANADAVIALSDTERDFLRAHYKMERPPVVIPNGIDPEIFRCVSPESRPKHATWNLLYCGQLIKLKRVDLLLEVLAKLPSNVELSLAYHVGDLEATLKTQAEALGIARRVHFLGANSARELAKLYQESDLFVLPSSGEALPSVVAEAMFCGTPVVATQVGGIPEQVGRFGLTIPANDVEALAGAIEHVLTNYPTYAAQAEEMSAYARARASIDAMLAKHLELYTRLAGGKHRVREHRNSVRPWSYLADKGMDWLCRRKCGRWSPPIAGHRKRTGDISN